MLLHLIAKLLQYRKPSTNGYKNVHNSVNIIKTENEKVNLVHCMGGGDITQKSKCMIEQCESLEKINLTIK